MCYVEEVEPLVAERTLVSLCRIKAGISDPEQLTPRRSERLIEGLVAIVCSSILTFGDENSIWEALCNIVRKVIPPAIVNTIVMQLAAQDFVLINVLFLITQKEHRIWQISG